MTTTTLTRRLADREIVARNKLAAALHVEANTAHPHTQSMALDVLQVAATSGWSDALAHLRRSTSSQWVTTAQAAARLLAQYEATASDTH